MTEYTPNENDTLTRDKVDAALAATTIVDDAITLLLNNFDEVFTETKALNIQREGITKKSDSQLTLLANALVKYNGVITEQIWEKLFRANVAEKLQAPRADGSVRYNSKNSRDVMVNTIKVSTMGITLWRSDQTQWRVFYPSGNNLKHYAEFVRDKLQKSIDPETEKPRLRSITRTASVRRLPEDTYYYLVGCETDKGLRGANTIIAGSRNETELSIAAGKAPKKFKYFLYTVAKFDQFEIEELVLPVQNSSVLTDIIEGV